MKKNRLYSTCRCCGLQKQEEYYFYDCNNYGTLTICPCCGCESGNHDYILESLLMYRYEWENGNLHWQDGNPNIWFDEAFNFNYTKAGDWDKEKQMQNIPRYLLINGFPIYALTPRERSICRICGYEKEEQDFFYDDKGYPKYRYCPCCGGISGWDDATLPNIYRYRYDFTNQSKSKAKALELDNIPQEFLQNQPSYIPTIKEKNICRICGYEAKGEDLLYDERGYLKKTIEQDFFYDDKGYPKYRYCPCCGGQSGYDDFELRDILRERYFWIKNLGNRKPTLMVTREGRSWRKKIKNKNWTLQSQLNNIPQEFLQNQPSYIPTIKEKNICRICGYEAKGEDLLYDERGYLKKTIEQDFFYDDKGYPKYRYCPCCGGQSGYDDFNLYCINIRYKAWKCFTKNKISKNPNA